MDNPYLACIKKICFSLEIEVALFIQDQFNMIKWTAEKYKKERKKKDSDVLLCLNDSI